MQKSEKMDKIKKIVNEVIQTYVHRPQCIYISYIAKYNINIAYINEEKVIRLSCRTWQDNYYNELVDRARLDIQIYTMKGEGEHLYLSSQYGPLSERELEEGCFQQPEEFLLIEKVLTSIYGIYNCNKKIKELYSKSRDISPGSPIEKLKDEFYNRDWTI